MDLWPNKKPLTAAFSLACLKIRSRNEEGINSTRNETDLLAKCLLLPTLSTSILLTSFWIDLVRVLATTGNTSAVAGYTRVWTHENSTIHATILSPSFHGVHKERLAQWPPISDPKTTKMPRGYFQKNWVGMCRTLPETLTLFQTKICDFPYPISDLKPWSPARDRSAWQAVTARLRWLA